MKVSYYILLISVLFFGCDRSGEEPLIPPQTDQGLTISEARKWIQDHPSNYIDPNSIIWELGELTSFEENPIIKVPVYTPTEGIRIAGDAEGEREVEDLSRQSIIFYRGSDEKIFASLMAQEERISTNRNIYFFDYHDLQLQSIWNVHDQILSGYSATEPDLPANARRETCGYFEKWINHCGRTARPSGQSTCWEYIGRAWTCIPDFTGEVPPVGGGPTGGIPGGPYTGPSPGVDFTPRPPTGFSPYLNTQFKVPITMGQSKHELLLKMQPPQKLMTFLLATSIKSKTYFSELEMDYLETLSVDELNTMADWVNNFPNLEISSIENTISRLKGKFNRAEKEVLKEYSGDNTALYRINVLRYGANAYGSTKATHAYFGNQYASECGDCKGNAFKHALFRIFDAVSFGREIARRLGEAHESEEDLNESTIMDKKNNAVGLQIYDEYKNGGAGSFYWGSKVGDRMKNGDLVYLINGQSVRSDRDDPTIRGPL